MAGQAGLLAVHTGTGRAGERDQVRPGCSIGALQAERLLMAGSSRGRTVGSTAAASIDAAPAAWLARFSVRIWCIWCWLQDGRQLRCRKTPISGRERAWSVVQRRREAEVGRFWLLCEFEEEKKTRKDEAFGWYGIGITRLLRGCR